VNPEANTNGERRDPTDHLAYMSKNLFRFKAWLDSRTTIWLSPAGYDSLASDSLLVSEDGKTRSYHVDDPELFWAGPERAR